MKKDECFIKKTRMLRNMALDICMLLNHRIKFARSKKVSAELKRIFFHTVIKHHCLFLVVGVGDFD